MVPLFLLLKGKMRGWECGTDFGSFTWTSMSFSLKQDLTDSTYEFFFILKGIRGGYLETL